MIDKSPSQSYYITVNCLSTYVSETIEVANPITAMQRNANNAFQSCCSIPRFQPSIPRTQINLIMDIDLKDTKYPSSIASIHIPNISLKK